MIVLDTSAAVAALLNDGVARRTVAAEQLHAPHLVDVEVTSVLRRHVAAGRVPQDGARTLLHTWQRLGLVRYPMTGLLDRVWELREAVSAYDACYVALAEMLGCALVTADTRLGRAPGPRCAITLVPS